MPLARTPNQRLQMHPLLAGNDPESL